MDSSGGNVTTPDPVQVTELTEDGVNPELVEYTLDVDAGELQLTFDETIIASSIDPSGATLHDTADLATSSASLQLTGGSPSANGAIIVFVW